MQPIAQSRVNTWEWIQHLCCKHRDWQIPNQRLGQWVISTTTGWCFPLRSFSVLNSDVTVSMREWSRTQNSSRHEHHKLERLWQHRSLCQQQIQPHECRALICKSAGLRELHRRKKIIDTEAHKWTSIVSLSWHNNLLEFAKRRTENAFMQQTVFVSIAPCWCHCSLDTLHAI